MRVTIVSWIQEIGIEISLREAVLGIKDKIEQILGVPMSSQTLSVSGWELVDGLDMEDYPIVQDGTRIELTIKPTNPDTLHYISPTTKIPIVVKLSARQMTMEVDTTETVRSLKEKIHILEGTPIKIMTLFIGGRELEDDFRNVREYGVGEMSEIVVYLKSRKREAPPPARRVRMVVQTSSTLMNGARIPVEMSDSGTVTQLREMLTGHKVIPADDYLFVHKQRIMRDHCSLRWHGVDNGDLLYLFKGTIA